MKKVVLILLLISFLAVPNIVLGGVLDVGISVPCEPILSRDECIRTEGCFWNHPDPPHCRHYSPPIPDIPFLEGLERITNALFFILITVAVISIIIGAFMFLTAQGEEDKIKTGRQQILYAVIAVVVAIFARGIVDFIRRRLEGG